MDWVSDGFCDDADSSYGINLHCEAYDFDGGDCDGGGGSTVTVDCDGNQIDPAYLSWKGDCGCDDKDSDYGINFVCEEHGYDGGDCDIPLR